MSDLMQIKQILSETQTQMTPQTINSKSSKLKDLLQKGRQAFETLRNQKGSFQINEQQAQELYRMSQAISTKINANKELLESAQIQIVPYIAALHELQNFLQQTGMVKPVSLKKEHRVSSINETENR